MALNIFAPVHVHKACVCTEVFFDKVLCTKVTITFITDVVYIFDILMFILFCEEESKFRKIQKLVMCVYWYCTGSDLCFVTFFPSWLKHVLDIF